MRRRLPGAPVPRSTPYLVANFDGSWHVVDPRDGQARELVGADGLDLEQVQASIETLYADTFASRNPAQRRML